MDSDGGCQPRPQTANHNHDGVPDHGQDHTSPPAFTAGLDGPIDALCLDRTGSVGRWAGRWGGIILLRHSAVLYCHVGAYRIV